MRCRVPRRVDLYKESNFYITNGRPRVREKLRVLSRYESRISPSLSTGEHKISRGVSKIWTNHAVVAHGIKAGKNKLETYTSFFYDVCLANWRLKWQRERN